MAWLKAFLVLSLIYLATGDDSFVPPGPNPLSNNSTTGPNPTTPITTTSSTTKLPNTTISTSTTPKTTTTSTSTTPTTTALPNTTTTSTTTTTTPTTPTTSTTSKPTTTTKPPTPQPLTPGKWFANYTNSNRTCLVLEAALQIDLLYKVGNATKNHQVNVTAAATATGYCSNNTENITLSFDEGNSVTFNIQKSNDSKKYDVESIMVTVTANLSPDLNVTQFVLIHQHKEFSTPVSNSYKCMPERKLNLTAVDKNSTYFGELHFSHFQVQAFRNSTNQKFGEALDCEGSETPDVVPIAVGCALAALVIIVLVAYLIGRRRSQARGYLSM